VFGSPEYVGATSLVALVVAGMLLLARVFRLGFLADFLSRSALIGFLTGAVAISADAIDNLRRYGRRRRFP
jgi:MFS superfamily sulfate permease-like transporter